MKSKFTCIFLLFVLFISTSFSQNIKSLVDTGKNGLITFKRFDNSDAPKARAEQDFLRKTLKMQPSDSLRPVFSKVEGNYLHQLYQQYYRGIKVIGGQYATHSKNGRIESINGFFKKIDNIDINPVISVENALSNALSYINAEQYGWEDHFTDSIYKEQSGDPLATLKPKGELVLVYDEGNTKSYVLAYSFQIYAVKPLISKVVYIDANTAKLIKEENLILASNINGTGSTLYSGTQSIQMDSYSSPTKYRLQETRTTNGKTAKIQTYNMQNGGSYSAAVDFSNTTTNWSTPDAGIDVHWATEKVFDYWSSVRNRNSYNGTGGTLKGYVHANLPLISDSYKNNDNAFWNGTLNSMTYGDGTNFNPVTSLDIIAHEIGHGICQYTADLVYANESGALNEGLSDIWGAVIENWAAPTKETWHIGEDIMYGSSYLRSLENPNSVSNPDTYMGTYWHPTSSTPNSDNDYGGVHQNSSVLGFWFYLLSQGGSGTNDLGDSYSVASIGITKAASIVWNAESTGKLMSTSQYADARTAMINAATELYGVNSKEAIQTQRAWYAVGVGNDFDYSQLYPIAGPSTVCSSGTYVISNVPAGSTVVWSVSPTGIFNISPSGSSVTVTNVANGSGTLTATIDGYIIVSKDIRNAPTILSVDASLSGACTSTAWQEWYLDVSLAGGVFDAWHVASTSGGAQVNIYSAHWVSISKGSASLNFTYHDSCGNIYTAGGPTIYKPCASTTLAAPAPLYLVSPNPAVNSININPNKASLNLFVKDTARANEFSTAKEATRQSEIIQINIYDQSGNRKQQRNFNKARNARLNIGNFPNGIYFVELILKDGSKEKHSLIIKH